MADSDKTAAAPPELRADRSWYDSFFTQLLAPLVATRYLWLALEDINPLNFRGKQKPATGEGQATWKKPGVGRYVFDNFAAHAMGATFLSIVGLYSKNTLHDIKSMYAEAVGYELGKKTEDVTFGDIFSKSKNQALEVTRSAYIKRTLARIATTATFFLPWHKLQPREFRQAEPKYSANTNVGVGALGTYLCAEGFLRDPSFFDLEQKMVSTKIRHHSAMNPYASVHPQDVLTLLFLQRKHHDKDYQIAPAGSPQGQNDIKLATRIAELFNETYHNAPDKEQAHFTIGKFNYLIGFGLLDTLPQGLAFVELANRSKDMSEVKQAAAAIQSGRDPAAVFAKWGIDINQIVLEKEPDCGCKDGPKSERRFTKTISPKTHQEFAAQTSSQRLL